MRIPSDEALELLDFLIETHSVSPVGAATSEQLVTALDIRSIELLDGALQELLVEDIVRKKRPTSVTGRTTYYANEARFSQLVRQLDGAEIEKPEPEFEIDWPAVQEQVAGLVQIVNGADLPQSEKAQAGALVSSIRILVDAPEPPKALIRNLLYDLAAIATLFALALQIAEKLK